MNRPRIPKQQLLLRITLVFFASISLLPTTIWGAVIGKAEVSKEKPESSTTLWRLDEQTANIKKILAEQEKQEKHSRSQELKLDKIAGAIEDTKTSLTTQLNDSNASWKGYALSAFIGFLASMLSVLGYEWVRRPIIELTVGEPTPPTG